MAAVDEIAIKLGVKTGDLKAALSDAGASIKKFKKEGESHEGDGLLENIKKQTHGLKELHHLLAGGVIATAVKEFFALAIEGAKESTDATDQNAAAVREFAKGLENSKHVMTTIAVTTIGTFNRLGSAIGDVVNITASFLKNGTQGFEVWAKTADAVAATGKAADEAEKRLADLRKKHGEEFLAITKELADVAQRSHEQQLKGLDVYETERNLFLELANIRAKIRAYDGDALGMRKLVLELAKTQLAADDATLNVKKAQVEVQKKMAEDAHKLGEQMKKDQDERIKEAEDLSAKETLGAEQDIELFKLRTKNADLLTAGEHARLKVLEEQLVQKKLQVELDELHDKLIRGSITTAEKARLGELIKQLETIEKQKALKEAIAVEAAGEQLAAEKFVTSEMQRQLDIANEMAGIQKQIEASRSGTIKQKGDVQGLDAVQLDALIQKLNKSLAPIKAADASYSGVGTRLGSYKSIEQLMLQGNLDAALKERNLRQSFAQTSSAFGSNAAKQQYSPDDFARLSQFFNPDQMKKQAADIGSIAGTLRNVFPEQYSGIR